MTIVIRDLGNRTQLIDEDKCYAIDIDHGGDCCDWAEYNCEVDLGNGEWTFNETPELDADGDYRCNEVEIINIKTGETAILTLDCNNNGYYSANYASMKPGDLEE